jgi:hypothetical protein
VTINDLALSEYMTTIKLKAACLNTWCANSKEQRLFTELMEIETAAREAQKRLNAMKYGEGYVPPVEQMGT